MKIHKEYPKLFKTLSRLFGARKAVRLINKLKLCDCNLLDSHCLSGAFLWCGTKQGHNFWSKVANASLRIKGFKPLYR